MMVVEPGGPKSVSVRPQPAAWFGTARLRATVHRQPDDDEARTAHTISLMAEYVRQDAKAPIVRQAAYQAISHLAGRDARQEAIAVWQWVRSRVRFVHDSDFAIGDDAEVLVRPVDLLRMPQPSGDCDDFSMLVAALLRALGIPSAFVTVAADPRSADQYTHVYVVAMLPNGPLALDASHGPSPGWEPKPQGKRRVWPIDGGLGAIDWAGILERGASTAFDILKSRYGQPPEGTYIQRGSEVFYRQPSGAPPLAFPGVQVGGGLGTVLIAAAVLAFLLLIARR